MSAETYLVTGAAGFVGGHLVKYLRDRDIRVRAMVRRREGSEALEQAGVELVVGDLTNPKSLGPAVESVRGVYHIAALFRQQGVPDSMFTDVNVEGTRRLLEASVAAGVQRFIHCSTVGVLGHIADPPATEETPYNPGDIYQRTKMEGEKIALDAFRSGRIPGVVIRPAMIYGPGDTRTLKLFRMIRRRTFFYVGRGEAHVHWIDVRDLAAAFLLAMRQENRNGEVYIIAGKRSVPLRRMAEEIASQVGVREPWIRLPVRPMQWAGSLCEAFCRPLGIEPPIYRRRVDFYTKSRSFDASKANRELGFEPTQDLAGEIGDIIEGYRGLL
jgi:nucleoside-diphosphate-sugar epimerase